MAKQDFWLNPNFEPKRQFRFLVQLSLSGQDVTFLAKSVDRPSYSISENEHQFFNHTFYYPGRVTWNTIDLTLVDPVSPNASQLLYNYLEESGIRKPASVADATRTTITKSSATRALGRLVIQEIATPVADGRNAEPPPTSQIIGEWSLTNPFFTDVNFGSHDYGNEDMVEVSVTVRYDWAVYEAFLSPGKVDPGAP